MGNGPTLEEIRNFRFRINPVESEVGRDMFGYRIMRPMSLYLTGLFLLIGISANTVTVLQFLIGLLGAAVIAWGDATTRFWGVLFLYFGFWAIAHEILLVCLFHRSFRGAITAAWGCCNRVGRRDNEILGGIVSLFWFLVGQL